MQKWAGWLTIILIVAALVEVTSFAIYKIILLPRAAFVAYTPPPLPEKERYERFLARRDPILGWPNKQEGAISSRPSPAFSATEHACLSMYGDSLVLCCRGK